MSTEAKVKSQTKKVLDTVGREFFQMYCDENKVLEQNMANLVEMANDSEDRSVQLNANKFLVEQLIGKPKQSVDMDMVNGIEIKFTREELNEETDKPKV